MLEDDTLSFPVLLSLDRSPSQDLMHFDLETFEPPDRKWGAMVDGKWDKWNGIVGMLSRGEADITSLALSVLKERARVMDFCMTVFNDKGRA